MSYLRRERDKESESELDYQPTRTLNRSKRVKVSSPSKKPNTRFGGYTLNDEEEKELDLMNKSYNRWSRKYDELYAMNEDLYETLRLANDIHESVLINGRLSSVIKMMNARLEMRKIEQMYEIFSTSKTTEPNYNPHDIPGEDRFCS